MKRFIKYLLFTNLFYAFYLYLIHKMKFVGYSVSYFKGRPIKLRSGKSEYLILNQIFADDQYSVDNYVNDPKTIIDGGANCGLSAIYFKNNFPNAVIYCFEPQIDNYALLQFNTKKLKDVHNFNLGIWSEDTILYLNHKSAAADFYIGDKNVSEGVKIDVVSIDTIIKQNNIDRINILKLDIEGAEKEIFSSECNWLDKTDCILIEVHDRFKKDCAKTLFNKMSEYDYDLEVSGETLKFFNINRIN